MLVLNISQHMLNPDNIVTTNYELNMDESTLS